MAPVLGLYFCTGRFEYHFDKILPLWKTTVCRFPVPADPLLYGAASPTVRLTSKKQFHGVITSYLNHGEECLYL